MYTSGEGRSGEIHIHTSGSTQNTSVFQQVVESMLLENTKTTSLKDRIFSIDYKSLEERLLVATVNQRSVTEMSWSNLYRRDVENTSEQ